MAGWSKKVDGSSLSSFKKSENPKNLVKNEVDYDNTKLLFIEVLAIFFKEVTGTLCYRPLPPMLGDGKSVDLFKLYLIVRKNGGYQRVSENGSWGLVAKDCGFDSSYGLALKLVYVKYLDALEKWMLRLKKIDSSSSVKSEVSKCDLSSVELDLKEILMTFSDEKAKEDENVNGKLRKKGEQVCDDVDARGFDGSNGSTEKFDGKSNLDSNVITVKDIEETRSVVVCDEDHLKFVDGTDDSLTKSSRKRKKGIDTTDGEQLCDGVEARGFEGLNESTERFDGKSNLGSNVTTVKDIEETRTVVVYDEDHLKFVDGTDDSLTKSSMVEEDCISRKRKKGFDTTDGEQLCDGVEARGFEGLNESTEKFDGKSNLGSNVTTVKDIEETRSVVYDEEHLKSVDGTDDSLTKSSMVEEDCISRKRKRESYLDLVKWVSEVARNPCDPAIGILPERSKWKDYGSEMVWKQVMLLRDEMLLKRDVDPCAQYSVWQIKQKMHPSMYDDSSGSGRLRCSQRVLSAKDHLKKMRALQFSVSPSSCHNDEEQIDGLTDSSAESAVGFWWKQRRKKIPVGPQFQPDIPEWIEEIYESDSKWLGTGIWPLDKRGKKRTLIDRGPIGKGREDICSCKSRGSYDCVKFHLSEKRRKLKIDLGSAYYQWKFDSMGEEVALSWSREEERKFQDIVKSNPLSEEKSFWNEIFKFFPNKSRESLVSYYFNVFLLRRRGNQNRSNASDVDSDDDESEYGPRFDCFGRDAKFSIFRSPRKSTSGSEVVHES